MAKEAFHSDPSEEQVSEYPEETRRASDEQERFPESIRTKQLEYLADAYLSLKQGKRELLDELFLHGGEHAVLCEIFGDPDQYHSSKELNAAIESGRIVPWWMKSKFNIEEYFDKIDSQVLEKMIQASNGSIKEIREMLRAEGYGKMTEKESLEKYGPPDPIDRRTLERYQAEMAEAERQILKAERVKQLQLNFERKFEELAEGGSGQESSLENENSAADKLFLKYQEIVNQAKQTRAEMKAMLQGQREASEREADQAADVILRKADRFLREFLIKLKDADENETEALLGEMDCFQADLVLGAGIAKTLGREGMELREMAGLDFEKLSIRDLTQKGKLMALISEIYSPEEKGLLTELGSEKFEKRLSGLAKERNLNENEIRRCRQIGQILEMYKKNFRDRPELQEELIAGISDVLDEGSQENVIYLLSRNSQLMGFVRYDSLDEETKQVASFNMDASVRNMSVGGALFLESLAEEAADGEITGVCDGFSPANVFYVEKAGFFVDRIDLAGMKKNKFPDFYIRKDRNEKFLFEGMAPKQIEQEYGKQRVFAGQRGTESQVRKVEKGKMSDLKSLAESVNQDGFAITRIVEGEDCFYCALEKTVQALSDSRLPLAA